MGGDFLRNCKAGVFQFVIVKFLLAVLTLFLRIIGCYEEGNYNTNSSYLWITGICGASQSWAFYSLCLFYSCSYNDLVTMRPFMKFFCLKMVIFFCWWQGVAIGLLVKLGQINSAHGHSVQEVADLIQDLLISMEMLVAAIAFFNSFPIMEFANVRQFNWNPLSVTPLASSAVQPAMQSMESMGHSPKKSAFVPSVGSSMGSTAASSTSHDLTITSSGSSNSNSNSNSSNSGNSSSGSSSIDALLTQSDLESEKSRLIIPEISTSIRSQSPVSDCGQSPSVYSSRKIFLPYSFPATKSDSKEQNAANDKNGRAGVGLGKRMTVDSDADSGRATDFTSRLFALRGAGYELLRGVVPSLSFVPSSSFTISINDNKRQRHDSPPPNPLPRAEGEVKEEVGRRGDSRGALTDCRSDPNSPAYINRSISYSHESTTPLLLASQGGRHGDDSGGPSSMGQMGSKVKVPPHILAGLSPLPSPSQHASDSRGLLRGLKGAGAAVTLPSPVARRRAATTYQTGSINSSIINSNINININSNSSSSSSSNPRLANNSPCEAHTSDDSHIDTTAGNSHMHSRLLGSSPTPLRHSPMSMSMSNKEARSPPTPTPTHLTPHRGGGRKSVSPNIMEARKNVNHSNSSICVRDSASALSDSQKVNRSSNSNSSTDAVTVSAQSQPYLRSQSPARGSTGKKDTTSSSTSSSSSAFQSTVLLSPSSSSSSSSSSSGCSRSCPNPSCAAKETHYNAGDHTIYHTPSQSRDGGREYTMRDSAVREERDDLRNERGYFIGSSTSNSASGNESYCLLATPITIIHIDRKRQIEIKRLEREIDRRE